MTTTPAFDLDRARRETPGCEIVLHFNNAGAALMPQPVLDAIQNHLRLEAETGGYEAAEQEEASIERVYTSAARLIGAHPDEVAVVENATRAWDMAFYSIPLQPGDRILTATAEYASNYIAYLQRAKATGAIIEVIPDDEHGQTSVAALERMLAERGRVKLIAVTHVPTNGGLVNPASQIGKIAREAGVLFLLDACQSIGQMPVDVAEVGCDLLSATGRKYLRGPRGIGFLYARRDRIEQLEPPFLDLHAAEWVARDRYKIRPDARRFENWEANMAAKIGLGAALDYALEWGIDLTWQRIQMLAELLRRGLERLPGVTVRDLGEVRCGIVTFTVAGRDPEEIKQQLGALGINVSVSTVSSTRLDMEKRALKNLVRASVHYYNSEEEVERFCEVSSKAMKE